MTIRTILVTASAVGLVLGTAPVMAKNDKTPPGNPCAKGNGNPCNGNNGNLGRQGNVGNKHHGTPPPIDIPLPPVSGRGAFITQIGDENVATVRQSAPNAYAKVDQESDGNEADVTQRGGGTGYVELLQKTGDGNFAAVLQDGPGQNVLYVTQDGAGNWAWSNQYASGATHNGAILRQIGNDNDMSLLQDGTDNRAVLTQNGDDNGMTVEQMGEGNRLVWTQNGDGLSDLEIRQDGGRAMQITQTAMGNGHGNGFGVGNGRGGE